MQHSLFAVIIHFKLFVIINKQLRQACEAGAIHRGALYITKYFAYFLHDTYLRQTITMLSMLLINTSRNRTSLNWSPTH